MRSRVIGLTAATALVAAVSPPATAGGASWQVECARVVVSPNFKVDKTVWCVGATRERTSSGTVFKPTLFRSVDLGRHWVRLALNGVAYGKKNPTALPVLLVSPQYKSDRQLFLAGDEGLYVSINAGNSFESATTAISTDSTGADPVLVNLGSTEGELVDGPVILHRGVPNVVFTVNDGTSFPGPFAADSTERWIAGAAVNRSDGILWMSSASPPSASFPQQRQWALGSCDPATLLCTDAGYQFPLGAERLRQQGLRGKGIALTLVVMARSGQLEFYASIDAGRTFQRWTSLESLVRPLAQASLDPGDRSSPPLTMMAEAVADPVHARRLYVRVTTSAMRLKASDPPGQQIYRSDDGGLHWKRVAAGPNAQQARMNGQGVSWNVAPLAGGEDRAALTIAPDGTLLVPAGIYGNEIRFSVHCSRDGGYTWRSHCSA